MRRPPPLIVPAPAAAAPYCPAARPVPGPECASRRARVELTDRLSVSVGTSASVLAWGTEQDDVGLAHISLPVHAGIAYDVKIGAATFTPFAAPAVAWYSTRRYFNGERIGNDSGWDARIATGASLRLSEIVLTAGSIRGEHGLPHRSRWTFAAGLSF